MPSHHFILTVSILSLLAACSKSSPEESTGREGSGGKQGDLMAQSGGASPSGGNDTASSGGRDNSGGQQGLGGSNTSKSSGGETSLGGQGGSHPVDEKDLLFLPASIVPTKLANVGMGLTLTASTLREGPDGPEFYAAVKNGGEDNACDPNISVQFYDKNDQSLATWIGGLYSAQLYRRSDDLDAAMACLGPGETAMAALVDAPQEFDVSEVGAIVYYFAYFNDEVLPFDLIPIESVHVVGVQSVNDEFGSTFTGKLENGLTEAMSEATISVFPLTQAGRPLGIATSSTVGEIPSGSTWDFETTPVDEPGTIQVAYPRFEIQ